MLALEVRWRLATFLDHDGTAPDRGRQVCVVQIVYLVVVDNHATVILVPNLDMGQVNGDAGNNECCINGGDHTTVIARAVDGAGALELCLWPGNHQPIISVGVKVQISYSELELRLACRTGAFFLCLEATPSVALPVRDGPGAQTS